GKGCAYVAQDHVLFDVAAMPDYGRLANRSLEEMEAGARVEVAPCKRGPMDFVHWKPSTPGEPSWPSPCGIAAPCRPGWHIECSAMAERHLGKVFDIHGGGIDLVFPHHENELAQSRCAHGLPIMAQVWMHNGFLMVEGEKMSKSLGNFVTIHELLATDKFGGRKWPGEVLRFTMLRTHYRHPIDWTAEGLDQSLGILQSWFPFAADFGEEDQEKAAPVNEVLCDDLNTPKAIAELHRLNDAGECGALGYALSLVGFSGETLKAERDAAEAKRRELAATVEPRIAARLAARKAKNFAEADRIRDELAAMGILLKDSKDPATGEIVTTWEVKR